MSWFKNLLKNGLMIRISTGKPFDPSEQVRTDGLKNIMDADKKEVSNGSRETDDGIDCSRT